MNDLIILIILIEGLFFIMKLPFPSHILSFSPWPFLVSFSLLSLLLNSFLHLYDSDSLSFYTSLSFRLFLFFLSLSFWFFDLFLEAWNGFHSSLVSNGLLLGVFLFLLSEFLIFFSLFYSYFYNAFIPDPSLGCLWPPLGLSLLDSFSLPFFNSFLLLSSAIALHIAHNLLLLPYFNSLLYLLFLGLTLSLGLTFSFCQFLEYSFTTFDISDSLFSNYFFILTGWHGIHVLIGSIFILISLITSFFSFSSSPLTLNLYSLDHHFSLKFFTFSSIYWHFVDFIWFFLFFFLYLSPSLLYF